MDWKQLIAQIQASGLSQPQIAAICGCGQATISDLVSGKTKDPRDSLGQALRDLLAKVQSEAAAETRSNGTSANHEHANGAAKPLTRERDIRRELKSKDRDRQAADKRRRSPGKPSNPKGR